MKQAHVFSVIAVFGVICAVAYAVATAQGLSPSGMVAVLSQTVVWIVAGGIAVASAAHEVRLAPARR